MSMSRWVERLRYGARRVSLRDDAAYARMKRHWLGPPLSSGSKTTSSLMPSGSVKKTA
jgi:hypothetical protein